MAEKEFNVQSMFYNEARKEEVPVCFTFLNGASITGRVMSFDTQVVLIDDGGTPLMAYKHSIGAVRRVA